jgi:hypothetical protein
MGINPGSVSGNVPKLSKILEGNGVEPPPLDPVHILEKPQVLIFIVI